ncbi:putative ATP-dependent endonuclease of the OLD family [Lutibacter agarilyticus]|uniref:Putative ATP-dependent endonuclease of the OLD family n=1 Tax=Lutibacter agarilyticus TaxID=1109740 RepID=A0A238WXH3_9FLAO|nr:AAA family ATPase [Lutibacter agarilyticus]SNR50914.1 putative ATP-dependent endonuclease of the OLD family [Lutibacter agarilyticus]
MHIKSIEIKNFRNFSDFKIDFTEGFQTIIGENNIGKSNLYWAIRLVLDRNLSYNSRNLEEKEFYDFIDLEIDTYSSISIELYGDNLASMPNLHALKISDDTVRISYLYAHKSKLIETDEDFDKIEIKDFQWRLYGGGTEFNIEEIDNLNQITFRDIEGINLYYISGFRNINSDLFGGSKSLLSEYCKSRTEADIELESVKTILTKTSDDLNELEFIPEISETVKNKNKEIAGSHFTFPVSLGFINNDDNEVWNQLKLFFNPKTGKNVPINVLGLGQKNLLYLSLFLSRLINEQNTNEVNILLIEEPEAHLHPQLQKILFSNLSELLNTQVFMSSHSTHIASDCNFKNLNIIYKNPDNVVKSFSPFIEKKEEKREQREELLLKRYLDATRSELFFSTAVIFVEGVAEQFIIPAIAQQLYGVNLTEHNISVVPIHSRYFDPFLKLFQPNKLELTACAIIDGDSKEHEDDESTTAVANAKIFEVDERVLVFEGIETLEVDLFPSSEINDTYLKICFENLGHTKSYGNLMATDDDWSDELLKRVDGTVKKGRFAQELAINIDKNFIIPDYIKDALEFIFKQNEIAFDV